MTQHLRFAAPDPSILPDNEMSRRRQPDTARAAFLDVDRHNEALTLLCARLLADGSARCSVHVR